MISLKHPFVSAKPDGPDPLKVQATNWNDEHTLTQAASRMLGVPGAVPGPTEEMSGAQVLAFAGAEVSGAAAAAVAAHEGAADPHTGYQKESEKGVVNGYASLDGGGTVPDAQIPAAIARDAEVTAAITAHEAAGDPHPVYLMSAEADALYAALVHASRHQDGGADEINVGGLAGVLLDAQKITVRKNTGVDVGTRARLNLIEGANITLTVLDDVAAGEVDVTIAAAAGGGGAASLLRSLLSVGT